jgi:flagellar biosynthetic protein FliP
MTMQTQTDPTARPAAPAPEAMAPQPEAPRRSPVRNFVWHYVEMVVAMLLGMFVLGFALAVPLELAGVDVSAWDVDAPALFLLSMAVTMTVPMVAWMRHRGHGWPACRDMTLAMFVPAFAAVGLLWGDVATGVHGLMGLEHTAMFTLMLVAMLLRRDEYTGH